LPEFSGAGRREQLASRSIGRESYANKGKITSWSSLLIDVNERKRVMLKPGICGGGGCLALVGAYFGGHGLDILRDKFFGFCSSLQKGYAEMIVGGLVVDRDAVAVARHDTKHDRGLPTTGVSSGLEKSAAFLRIGRLYLGVV
jgi:hypothetical protein